MSIYKPRKYKTTRGQRATVPIKEKKYMNAIMRYFLRAEELATTWCKKYNASRNYMICLLGFNTAFRAEDLLQLKVNDVDRGYISIKEFKTKKYQTFPMNKALFSEIQDYIRKWNLTKYDYLFSKKPGYAYPLTRQRGDDILKDVAAKINLKQPFSMHSLRKTFGYQKYIETRDIFLVQRLLNHEEPSTTLIYICWDTVDTENERKKTYYSGLSKTYKRG